MARSLILSPVYLSVGIAEVSFDRSAKRKAVEEKHKELYSALLRPLLLSSALSANRDVEARSLLVLRERTKATQRTDGRARLETRKENRL